MSEPKFVVGFDEMKRFITDCMIASGAKEEHAVQLSDLLVTADSRGHYSHGVNRLHIYMEDVKKEICNGHGQPKILKQKGSTAWVDGDNSLGVVVGNFSTDLAIKLAREYGIGWVQAKNSNHYGIAGYYPLQMAKEKLIGMSFTNTSPLVFPNRSVEYGLGTNPISVIAPAANSDSFELDMATTTVALGKIEVKERKGEKIPSQWAVDSKGLPTHNPADVTKHHGSLTPLGGEEMFGGYKGSGLAMMVELFCGILSGSHFGKNIRLWRDLDRKADLGQCFVAIDPDCFAPEFGDRLKLFLDETRSLKPSNPTKPVMVPGDPERIHKEKCAKAGGLLYGKVLIDHLETIAKQNNIDLFAYEQLESV